MARSSFFVLPTWASSRSNAKRKGCGEAISSSQTDDEKFDRRALKPCSKKRVFSPNHLSRSGACGSHHGPAATAAYLQEAGYIYRPCRVWKGLPAPGGIELIVMV